MGLDAPGSEENLVVVAIILTIWAYPLGLGAGIISSWVAYALKKDRLAYWLNCIPLLWIAPIVIFWGYALLS